MVRLKVPRARDDEGQADWVPRLTTWTVFYLLVSGSRSLELTYRTSHFVSVEVYVDQKEFFLTLHNFGIYFNLIPSRVNKS